MNALLCIDIYLQSKALSKWSAGWSSSVSSRVNNLKTLENTYFLA